MSKVQWVETQKATSFRVKTTKLRVGVTRHIDIDKTDWLLECEPFFRVVATGNVSADVAKEHCLLLVRKALKKALEEFGA